MTQTARATLILVAANLAVYFIMLVAWLLHGFYPNLLSTLTEFLSLNRDAVHLITSPWTILSYMFTHISFVHLTVNMLWLIGFCPMIKGNYLSSVAAYLIGGIAGGLAFIGYSFINEPNSGLAGASAAVISVIITATCLSPERKLQMIFIGEVRLKWVALFAVVTLFAFSPSFSAATAAHLGGAIAGLIIGIILKIRDKAISEKALTSARQRTRQLSLLQKAERSGFTALSENERLELFNLHKSHYNTGSD